jgi:hypothetical protein
MAWRVRLIHLFSLAHSRIGIAIGIETFREKFNPDSDPDPERAEKCCAAKT